jgi:hypothetical protein
MTVRIGLAVLIGAGLFLALLQIDSAWGYPWEQVGYGDIKAGVGVAVGIVIGTKIEAALHECDGST